MKIQTVYERFLKGVRWMCCPVCGSAFTLQPPGTLRCTEGHCFDLSTKGSVNFLSGRRHADYSASLFSHRQAVYGMGVYGKVLDALCGIAQAHTGGHLRILDAGCGEGYYATGLYNFLQPKRKATVFAADVSREAIQAADKSGGVLWMVADLARLPLANGSTNLLLNCLSPANYAEFGRVLAPGGLLLKVVPGADYLREIREAAAGQLRHAAYSNEKTISHFQQSFALAERQHICYTVEATPELLKSLLHMTPLTRSLDMEKLETAHLRQITIDMEILVGRAAGAC